MPLPALASLELPSSLATAMATPWTPSLPVMLPPASVSVAMLPFVLPPPPTLTTVDFQRKQYRGQRHLRGHPSSRGPEKEKPSLLGLLRRAG